MNTIEKAKEISMGLAEDFADWMGPSWPMCGAQNAINKLAEMAEKRMIAALEAEKPAEDAFHAAKELTGKIGRVEIDLFKANELPGIDGKTFAGFSSKVVAEILLIIQEDIQSFAESYHERRIKEAQAVMDAEPRGMIAGGATSPFSLNAQLKRCESYHAKKCAECHVQTP